MYSGLTAATVQPPAECFWLILHHIFKRKHLFYCMLWVRGFEVKCMSNTSAKWCFCPAVLNLLFPPCWIINPFPFSANHPLLPALPFLLHPTQLSVIHHNNFFFSLSHYSASQDFLFLAPHLWPIFSFILIASFKSPPTLHFLFSASLTLHPHSLPPQFSPFAMWWLYPSSLRNLSFISC